MMHSMHRNSLLRPPGAASLLGRTRTALRHSDGTRRRALRLASRADYRKGGEESKRVDGRVTQLWKFFFRPGVGTTDRLGVAISFGKELDQRTADERFEARQDAARGAINIDGEERRRRLVFGGSLLVALAFLVKYLVDKQAGPLERLEVLPLFFLGMSEADVWDVDGTGMQTVPDFKLSKKIRKKVLSFVSAGAVATIFVVGAFCFWPL